MSHVPPSAAYLKFLIETVRVRIAGYEDYHMALKTLEENLAETGDRVVEIGDVKIQVNNYYNQFKV